MAVTIIDILWISEEDLGTQWYIIIHDNETWQWYIQYGNTKSSHRWSLELDGVVTNDHWSRPPWCPLPIKRGTRNCRSTDRPADLLLLNCKSQSYNMSFVSAPHCVYISSTNPQNTNSKVQNKGKEDKHRLGFCVTSILQIIIINVFFVRRISETASMGTWTTFLNPRPRPSQFIKYSFSILLLTTSFNCVYYI